MIVNQLIHVSIMANACRYFLVSYAIVQMNSQDKDVNRVRTKALKIEEMLINCSL